MVSVIASISIEQAGLAHSCVAAFNADTDPLISAGLDLDAGAIAAAISVAGAAKVSVVDLLIPVTQLVRLTA